MRSPSRAAYSCTVMPRPAAVGCQSVQEPGEAARRRERVPLRVAEERRVRRQDVDEADGVGGAGGGGDRAQVGEVAVIARPLRVLRGPMTRRSRSAREHAALDERRLPLAELAAVEHHVRVRDAASENDETLVTTR